MKYFDSSDGILPESPTKRVFYNKRGSETLDEQESIAQVLYKLNGKTSKPDRKYFIYTVNGSIYDPNGVDGNKKKNMTFLLKQVGQEIFDFYILYLTTNNPIYLTRAQRSFISDR